MNQAAALLFIFAAVLAVTSVLASSSIQNPCPEIFDVLLSLRKFRFSCAEAPRPGSKNSPLKANNVLEPEEGMKRRQTVSADKGASLTKNKDFFSSFDSQDLFFLLLKSH